VIDRSIQGTAATAAAAAAAGGSVRVSGCNRHRRSL